MSNKNNKWTSKQQVISAVYEQSNGKIALHPDRIRNTKHVYMIENDKKQEHMFYKKNGKIGPLLVHLKHLIIIAVTLSLLYFSTKPQELERETFTPKQEVLWDY